VFVLFRVNSSIRFGQQKAIQETTRSHMDTLLQLLLPEIKELPNLERQQRVFTWDGIEYPQEPVEYLWGPHVKLVTSQIHQFLFRFLPRGYATEKRERDWGQASAF